MKSNFKSFFNRNNKTLLKPIKFSLMFRFKEKYLKNPFIRFIIAVFCAGCFYLQHSYAKLYLKRKYDYKFDEEDSISSVYNEQNAISTISHMTHNYTSSPSLDKINNICKKLAYFLHKLKLENISSSNFIQLAIDSYNTIFSTIDSREKMHYFLSNSLIIMMIICALEDSRKLNVNDLRDPSSLPLLCSLYIKNFIANYINYFYDKNDDKEREKVLIDYKYYTEIKENSILAFVNCIKFLVDYGFQEEFINKDKLNSMIIKDSNSFIKILIEKYFLKDFLIYMVSYNHIIAHDSSFLIEVINNLLLSNTYEQNIIIELFNIHFISNLILNITSDERIDDKKAQLIERIFHNIDINSVNQDEISRLLLIKQMNKQQRDKFGITNELFNVLIRLI